MTMLVIVMMVVVLIVMMRMSVVVVVTMFVMALQMNIELHACNAGFLLARDMEVITIDLQFLQLVLELMRVDAQIQQRGHKHIAADAAENIEVKNVHKFQAPSSKLQRNPKFQNPKHH